MISPGYDEFAELARRGNVVPVTCEILADLETPVSAFLKIHRGGHGFLFESVEGGEKWGRYSFLGSEPDRIWVARDHRIEMRSRTGEVEIRQVSDVLAALREWLRAYRPVPIPDLPRFAGGAVGYIGYDLVRDFERLPVRARDDLGLPEAYFLLADRLLVFDNVRQKIRLVANAILGEGENPRIAYERAVAGLEEWLGRLRKPVPESVRMAGTPPAGPFPIVRSNMSQGDYEAIVARAKEYVRAGDVIQVVLAQRFETELRAKPFDIYRSLRSINPSPYLFFLALGDVSLAGASPEVMVRVEGEEITVRPIAGTRPRGTVERDDLELERELLADPKEVAEHIMLL
ncbi:MAG: anthranilate synthase component I family protein, partial [Candidatus Binatia bacterium]